MRKKIRIAGALLPGIVRRDATSRSTRRRSLVFLLWTIGGVAIFVVLQVLGGAADNLESAQGALGLDEAVFRPIDKFPLKQVALGCAHGEALPSVGDYIDPAAPITKENISEPTYTARHCPPAHSTPRISLMKIAGGCRWQKAAHGNLWTRRR